MDTAEFQEGADREGIGPQVAGRRRAADQTGAFGERRQEFPGRRRLSGSFVTMGNGLSSGIARLAPLGRVLGSGSGYFGIRPGNRQERSQNQSLTAALR